MDEFTLKSPKKPQNLHRSAPTFAPQYAPARTTVQNILYRSTKSILSHYKSSTIQPTQKQSFIHNPTGYKVVSRCPGCFLNNDFPKWTSRFLQIDVSKSHSLLFLLFFITLARTRYISNLSSQKLFQFVKFVSFVVVNSINYIVFPRAICRKIQHGQTWTKN